ncbi:MAG: hypothetical protein IJS54_01775 [Desulfovibrio sp.]|nr:hypothetical protein [Desulfovibrio sp.]
MDRIQRSCQTTEDAIRFAQELATTLKQWQPEQMEQSQSAQKGGNNKDPEQSPSTDARQRSNGGNGQEPPSNENQNAKDNSGTVGGTSSVAMANGDGEVGESDCDHEESGNRQGCQPESSPESCIRDLFNCDETDLPKSLGEHLADRLEGEREPRKETSITVATVGKTSLCNIGVEEKEEALRASCALRSRLQGLLQASTRKHVGSARRGTLATKSLYRLSIGSPRIFQSQDESQGLSTAIHLLLDVSSSMSGQAIKLARQSCYAVLKALSGIKGINPAVTAYPAFDLEDSVVPLALHGKPIPPYLNVQACGSTPLAQALWWVMQEMLPLKENRKIILILTDGIPDSVPAAQSAIETAEKIGFEIFGLGMHLRVIRDFLPKTSKVIYGLNDLPNALFGLLQQTLVPTM